MIVLLTGSTGGIGRALATALASRGESLLLHGRDRQKVEQLATELSAAPPAAPASPLVADLASLAETAGLAGRVAALGGVDVLINNAGVGFGRDGNRRETSRDGFELRFAVNYLAPFLLTEELLGGRAVRQAVINVASAGQEEVDLADLMMERGYSGVSAYCRSKLALIMATRTWAARHPLLQVQSLHPGTYLDTGMVREAGIRPLGPVSTGVQSILAVMDGALRGGESGRYFDQSRPSRARGQAYDEAALGKLREASLALVAPFRTPPGGAHA
ncbi:MAG TPA: SDR family NAD(P)-dependent oxidoreductase [Spirochaetia bacterium]|nr:SDR family NAD(P)-dependent oxidoreductase [Spirochaetia bacterium]